ncbi:hypothetical protein ACN47E_003215 [Coniothyrium glycines]
MLSPPPLHETLSTHQPAPPSTAPSEPAAPEQQPPSSSSSSEPPPRPASKKRKTKDTQHILHTSTFRKPAWSYMHICLITPGATSSSSQRGVAANQAMPAASNDGDGGDAEDDGISPLLASSLLTAALLSYLGATGAAVPIDVLKTRGRDVWIRVPREDARAVRAGLSNWTGGCEAGDVPGVAAVRGSGGRVQVAWRVVGESAVLLGVVGGDGMALFGD